jgi:predicted nucleic acid-binding protein
MANPPAWVEISDSPAAPADSLLSELGAGETEAIFLASEFDCAILLMDDRRGVAAALLRGLTNRNRKPWACWREPQNMAYST